MLTTGKRKFLFWLSVVIFLAMIPVVILYALGYRLDDNWRLQKTGGIYITTDVPGSEIFLDGELERRTNLLQNGIFIDNLSPGNYEIAVLNQKYLPVQKKLNVASQLVTEARALLVPAQTNARILFQGKFSNIFSSTEDPLFVLGEEKNSEKIIRWYLPEREEFLTDTGALLKYKNDFEIIRWLSGGAILKIDGAAARVRFNIGAKTVTRIALGDEGVAKTEEEVKEALERIDNSDFIKVSYAPEEKILRASWIGKTIRPYYFSSDEEILLENKEIRNFELYPGRRDAVLASFDNGIWAIEIDGRDSRIISPIYKGREPNFALVDGESDVFI